MEGRFVKYLLLILTWFIILSGAVLALSALGLDGWLRFVALIPLLVVLRIAVRRFPKGKRP